MVLKSDVWPKDPIDFAAWALSEEGRIAIAISVTGFARSGSNSEGRIGNRDYDHVLALQTALDEIGSDPARWTGRFDSIMQLKLLAQSNQARTILRDHERLLNYLDESVKANVPWTTRQARIKDFFERLNLEVDALREILATAKPRPA